MGTVTAADTALRGGQMVERPDEEQAAVEELETAPEPVSPEVDEADALEQARPVQPHADEEPEAVGDLPEADALEQARDAGADDDADERR
jgi:hypothetical protein